MLVTRRENITRFGTTPEAMLEDFNLRPGESFGLSDPAIVNKYWNRPVEVDRTVDDGDTLEVGGLKLEVVHLPGHCPGHIGIWNPNTRTLYPGDVMHYPTPLGPYPIGDAQAHSDPFNAAWSSKPELLLEGHGLSAYSRMSSRRRLLHMQMQQRDMHERVLALLGASRQANDNQRAFARGHAYQDRFGLCCLDRHWRTALLRGSVHSNAPVMADRTGKGAEGQRGSQNQFCLCRALRRVVNPHNTGRRYNGKAIKSAIVSGLHAEIGCRQAYGRAGLPRGFSTAISCACLLQRGRVGNGCEPRFSGNGRGGRRRQDRTFDHDASGWNTA